MRDGGSRRLSSLLHRSVGHDLAACIHASALCWCRVVDRGLCVACSLAKSAALVAKVHAAYDRRPAARLLFLDLLFTAGAGHGHGTVSDQGQGQANTC